MSVDERAAAALQHLQDLEKECPGLMYEVATRLIAENPAREFPGPSRDWYPGKDGSLSVVLTGIDPNRSRLDALLALRKIGMSFQEAQGTLAGLPLRREVVFRHDAEQELALWTAAGFTAHIDGLGSYDPPASHVRHLRDLFRGPTA